VFRYPRDRSQFFIKRIIGLPGETVRIKDNLVSIVTDGTERTLDESAYLQTGTVTTSVTQEAVLGKDEFFVMGDNRGASSDSRSWGPVGRGDIIGRVWVRAYPFDRAEVVHTPPEDLLIPAQAP
ncbi:MAG: signal peptidase I, partial [Candidatus Andersenbacteria bacterium]